MPQTREILTVGEIRAADRAAAEAGVGLDLLMERAGRALAEAITARWPPRPVLVLCGPGDNGGDGHVAARLLADAGWPVTVARMGEGGQASGAAEAAAAAWTGPVVPLEKADPGGFGLVVDALFGAGLTRPLPAAAEAVLRQAAGRPMVAADLPSGLQGDSGKALGFAPRCDLTVTFHAKKPAHVLEPGRGLCGEVVVADIGIPAGAAPAARLWENTPSLWAAKVPWPTAAAHKHERGRLIVVSGPVYSTGAARLAARAGLRVGAGLVTVLSPQGALAVNAAQLEAVMVRGFETDDDLARAADEVDAAVIGPGAGVGGQTALNLMALARTGAALVVDADALTVHRDDPEALFDLLDRDDVLTPHAGEFERVFPGLLASAPDKVAAARKAADQAGAVVLLKGADTVIAAPDGRAAVNTNAEPWLATAGSGDVLAGLVAGLIAQGMESFEAACAGVWIHGEAGAGFGPGLISEDLPDLTPAVLKRLWAERGCI
jgi:hydroxyethylthiazole kinase-like uncharacterized protein yjeF